MNTEKKYVRVIRDTRIPPHGKGTIHKMICQLVVLYGMETVPVTSSHAKKLDVTDMKMRRWHAAAH